MSTEALEVIRKEVAENPIIIYMKGTPDFPQCGFSARAIEALKACGVGFAAVNVFEDEEVYRQGVKLFSNWPTIPQLYVKGELVGGSDIIMDLYQSGELQEMLQNAAQAA
ncbi:MAG: monothiol glutaredoxin, Grx4 family [Salinisphaeraceae bacterium]|jgi:monothiol glutaredoxin|nr:monothiol glutaredoxin, Grx4 family [Salinisphaeraceae bacterium]